MSTPLRPYTVSLILTYICPPSQLTLSPLSPHLISKPLLQRHHFLGIDPETDLKGYLMWATEDDQAFARLEGLAPPTLGDEDPVIGIRYTADKESIYAHAELRSWASHASPEIRLVFLWDPVDSAWKYHNIASMPFPVDATLNVADAVEQKAPSLEIQIKGDEDDDDYWNSYGTDNMKEHIPRNRSNGDLPGSEDAYWAQYASVQGTADSTVPTPRREAHGEETFDEALARARGLHNHDDHHNQRENHHNDQEVIDISYKLLNIPHPSTHPSRTSAENGVCPTDLSDRLNSLPPRTPHSINTELLSSPVDTNGVVQIDDYHSSTEVQGIDKSALNVAAINGAARSHSFTPRPPVLADGKNMDDATRSAICGVYEMWKMASHPADVDEFLSLVREAIIG
ncbi:hypothetical protein J3R30DRAFT_1465639 [Lentinula aciculospora]|uniref:Uncharacterized protein n=1 Tax=Lentinula aciculospora TaxID=153920 RepID=A0A9W9AQN5_9AGAR|nr:hypothetical protein J3R30DRAFT_1465639 [Lentinula aciculospora]